MQERNPFLINRRAERHIFMEKFTHFLNMLPFFLTAGKGIPHMNATRLIELIVSVAAAGGVAWGVITTQMSTFKEDLDNSNKRIEKSIDDVKTNQKETRNELKQEIIFLQAEFRDVKRDLYSPTGDRDSWGNRREKTIRR